MTPAVSRAIQATGDLKRDENNGHECRWFRVEEIRKLLLEAGLSDIELHANGWIIPDDNANIPEVGSDEWTFLFEAEIEASRGSPGDGRLDKMTIYSHNQVMTETKISELKARLSAYLAEVKAGGTVVVYDRTTPVARLVPFRAKEMEDVLVIENSSPPSALKRIKGVRPRKPIDLDRLLEELREDR